MTTEVSRPLPHRTARRLPLAAGVIAFLAVLLTLDDPGITIDEPLDVRVGRRYVEAIASGRWDPFRPLHVVGLFADNAQHPPLGRLLVGLASKLGEPFEALLGGPDPFSVRAARLAPAAAFGVLVGLITAAAARGRGPAAGAAAGLALVMMPRVFAHAHFATLDTILTLLWVAALLDVGRATASPRPLVDLAMAGLVWGMALLTKIHAWLLPPLVLAWVVARLGWKKGLAGFSLWTLFGLAMFFCGWPWLWHAPVRHLGAFLGTSVERLALRVEYFGRVYLDRDVPWHYPWLYFAATVPVGLHALGIVGLVDAWRRRREDASPFLLLGAVVLLLLVFSTKAPVYDGERLFLPVFPLWAVFVGRGWGVLWQVTGASRDHETLSPRTREAAQPPGEGDGTPAEPDERERAGRATSLTRPLRGHPLPGGEGRRWWIRLFLVGFLISQGWGVVRMHPFQLSYYNALVGGLPGASRLGLELTYWGDAVDRRLVDALAERVRPGQVVALVPTLHHVQAVATTTQLLADRGIILQDQAAADRADWLVVYRRTAYWPDGFEGRLEGRQPVVSHSRQGVWLATLWDMAGPPKTSGTN